MDAGAQIRDAEAKAEHLEGQLCNAQSLIHKLLKLLDAAGVTVPDDLRRRADTHVEILLEHKKAEHAKDLEYLKREMATLATRMDQQQRAAEGQRVAAENTRKVMESLRERLERAEATTDKDILG